MVLRIPPVGLHDSGFQVCSQPGRRFRRYCWRLLLVRDVRRVLVCLGLHVRHILEVLRVNQLVVPVGECTVLIRVIARNASCRGVHRVISCYWGY